MIRERQDSREGLALVALFALPILAGFVARWMTQAWWFNDLDAVLCGAWRVAHGASPYAETMACPGGRPAAYMYLPQFAHLLAPLAGGPDISGLRLVFASLSLVVVAGLIWVLFVRPLADLPRGLRAPMLALTSGGAAGCGNLAFPAHGLVFALATGRRRATWALIGAIVLVSVLKPVFLTYLLIFAYRPERLTVRAARIGVGLALALAAGGLVFVTGGPELVEWRAALAQVALGREVGFGFLSWMAHLGLGAGDRVVQLAYVPFAGLACLAGLAICEGRRLDAASRTLLAIGVAQIVNPRLMSYDLLMLAPLAVAFHAVPERLRAGFRAAVVLIGLTAFAVQFSGVRELVRLGPGLLTLLLLASGALAARDLLRGGFAPARAVETPA